MKKIKLVVIALMVFVIIGIAIYYSYCIMCINKAIMVKQESMVAFVESEKWNLREELTKSGIQNIRVEEILKNVDSEIHMKEAFRERGFDYDKYIKDRNETKYQVEEKLKNINDAKGVTGVFKLGKYINLYE